MPLGVALALLLIALLLLRRDRRRTASGFMAVAVVVLWAGSTPFVAKTLYRGIESEYPPTPFEQIPEGDCAIVLGGVVGPPLLPRVDTELYEAVDRVYRTAELYLARKVPMVVVTGGNQPWSETQVAEADLIRDLLVKWGVPKDKIFLEGSSRNTRENALYTRNLLNSINCESPLLVTSAAHMPRAVAAFNNVGFNVTPVSTDVRVAGSRLPGFMDFLPSAGALAMTSEAIREWIGQKIYAMKGW